MRVCGDSFHRKKLSEDVGFSTSWKIFLLEQQTAGLSVGRRAIFSSQKVS